MRKRIKIICVVFLAFFLTGCASIISKNMYPVSINSTPTGATVLIEDEDGKQIYKGKTPATITLEAGKSYFDAREYEVTFSLIGYENQIAVIKPKIDGWYFGNILIGGLIGMLIVDPITGAMWKLPSDLNVNMAEQVSLNKTDQILRIVTIDQVPQQMRQHLVKIN